MMTNPFYPPSPRYSDYVFNYLIVDDVRSVVPANEVVCVYPNGLNSLGFTFGDRTRHRTYAGAVKELGWGCFVVGTQEKAFHMLSTPNLKQFVIIFKPGVLSKLLRINMAEIRNSIFELGGVIKEEQRLCEQLAAAANHEQQIAVIEKWMMSRLQPDHARQELTQHVIQAIHKQAGDVKVRDICQAYRINNRYLERRFGELVGISPKQYADIIRFNYFLNVLTRHSTARWKDAHQDAGFNDYSHLSKQVQKLAGVPPKSLREQLTHKEAILYRERMNEVFNRVNMLRIVER